MEVISCTNIAQKFMIKSMSSGEPGMNMLKLQLMVYFANGWYLGQYDAMLCKENPVATESGPRYLALYDYFKCGDMDLVTDILTVDGPTSWSITPEIESVLDMAWDQYSSKSIERMLSIAMRFDDPWHRTWNRHKKMVEIQPETIWDHYHFFLELGKNGIKY